MPSVRNGVKTGGVPYRFLSKICAWFSNLVAVTARKKKVIKFCQNYVKLPPQRENEDGIYILCSRQRVNFATK